MRKLFRIIALTVCISVLLCGCSLWMDGKYSSVKPHRQEDPDANRQVVEVKNYSELRQELIKLIEGGYQDSMICLIGGTTQQLEEYMEMACYYAQEYNAVGAYAVDEISYQVGISSAKPAVAITIKYLHGRSEILQIKRAASMAEAKKLIQKSLDDCQESVLIRVNLYQPIDFTWFVEDYVMDNPQSCMELPQVMVAVYPKDGTERLIELRFTYQTGAETLRYMQASVKQIFDSAKLYVNTDAGAWDKYSLLYTFLMERYDYTVESSITPSYSLLWHGVGDSKAFAAVYAAMCRQAGLSCQTVTGTRDGETWTWNVILMNDVYYHVDLLHCSEEGHFRAKTAQEMTNYQWNSLDYELHSTVIP